MNQNEAVELRVAMINSRFAVDADTTAYMDLVRAEIAGVAARLQKAAPATCDIGRFIAAIDLLQQSKNVFIDSALLGGEAAARKKRKAVE
jgi:hypothetical protein